MKNTGVSTFRQKLQAVAFRLAVGFPDFEIDSLEGENQRRLLWRALRREQPDATTPELERAVEMVRGVYLASWRAEAAE